MGYQMEMSEHFFIAMFIVFITKAIILDLGADFQCILLSISFTTLVLCFLYSSFVILFISYMQNFMLILLRSVVMMDFRILEEIVISIGFIILNMNAIVN